MKDFIGINVGLESGDQPPQLVIIFWSIVHSHIGVPTAVFGDPVVGVATAVDVVEPIIAAGGDKLEELIAVVRTIVDNQGVFVVGDPELAVPLVHDVVAALFGWVRLQVPQLVRVDGVFVAPDIVSVRSKLCESGLVVDFVVDEEGVVVEYQVIVCLYLENQSSQDRENQDFLLWQG